VRSRIKLPRYGTNMEEGTVVQWLKAPGETFGHGDGLCEIETEKVSTILEAPFAGTVIELLAREGDVIAVGEGLCWVETAVEETT
jgi:pyruvate/2-oxoglutarate dehydrogenase complex dihydrolipoamide acyltransferase (E2) component